MMTANTLDTNVLIVRNDFGWNFPNKEIKALRFRVTVGHLFRWCVEAEYFIRQICPYTNSLCGNTCPLFYTGDLPHSIALKCKDVKYDLEEE
jgi:hypothetical protein